jgi:hypothetical protein
MTMPINFQVKPRQNAIHLNLHAAFSPTLRNFPQSHQRQWVGLLRVEFQKRQVEPLWHRLHTAKSSPPNARWPLWQVAQLDAPAGA